MPSEIGVVAAIAGKSVGQQMRIGGDIGFKKGAQLGARRGRQHGDACIAGEEPMLTLDGVPMFSAPVLRRRHLFDRSDDQAFVGVGGDATGACRVAAAMKVSSASRTPCSGRDGSSLSPWRSLCAMVQAV